MVKVRMSNKGGDVPLAIRGHYLGQLQSVLKPERPLLLSAQDSFHLARTCLSVTDRCAKQSPSACDHSVTVQTGLNKVTKEGKLNDTQSAFED